MNHIPTPYIAECAWIGTDEADPQTVAYIDEHRNRRFWSVEEKYATAAFMAKACNSHADLISTVRLLSRFIMDILPYLHDHADLAQANLNTANEVLKRSE